MNDDSGYDLINHAISLVSSKGTCLYGAANGKLFSEARCTSCPFTTDARELRCNKHIAYEKAITFLAKEQAERVLLGAEPLDLHLPGGEVK